MNAPHHWSIPLAEVNAPLAESLHTATYYYYYYYDFSWCLLFYLLRLILTPREATFSFSPISSKTPCSSPCQNKSKTGAEEKRDECKETEDGSLACIFIHFFVLFCFVLFSS